ncbi:MAG TPA: DUF1285 domain-containing protein, partial [bacterium]|nr:DUF1285 domain-containing protein [bacterium]
MKPPPADIRIDRDCRWFANGRPVVHEKIFKLFCASLVREQDSYFIRIGEQENPVIVEDVPFRVKSLFVENTGDGEDALNIYLNDDRIFRLDPATLRAEEGGSVYCS